MAAYRSPRLLASRVFPTGFAPSRAARRPLTAADLAPLLELIVEPDAELLNHNERTDLREPARGLS